MSEARALQTNSHLAKDEIEDADFLLRLGQRVRQIRAQRGMSRRLLAETAEVSERYLAQLESGKGNISVILLRQIARAMGVRIDTLVDIEKDLAPEYEIIRERLREMSSDMLLEVYADLFSEAQTSFDKTKRFALLGLRGAGKSTVGKHVAKKLGVKFIELTDIIENVAGMSLNEIFSLGGQSSYRSFESQAIDQILTNMDEVVLAVGGSVVADTSTFEKLLRSFTTVWLQASPEEHMQRVIDQGDKRPMAGNNRAMDELRRILLERQPLYQRAEHSINTQGRTVKQTCDDLLALGVLN